MVHNVHEDDKHLKAFELYYNMPERSFTKVAKEMSVGRNSVNGWASAFNWNARVAKRDNLLKRKMDEMVTSELAKMNMRHIEDALKLREAAFKILRKKIDVSCARDVATFLKLSIDIERLARGESTESIENKHVVTIDQVTGIFDELKRKPKPINITPIEIEGVPEEMPE